MDEDTDIFDTENYECPKLYSEDETLKSCTDVQITNILNHEELGRGTFGVLFPVVAILNGKQTKLAVKKIQVRLKRNIVPENVIHDLYYEIENSYKMGQLGIGPIVYDAFYTRDSKYINQYIIMEKMDISVRKWIELDARTTNFSISTCKTVTQEMLNLMYKQIFVHHVYCVDIKADNYLINFKPLKVKMIDFGADWCDIFKNSINIHNTSRIKKIFSRTTQRNFLCIKFPATLLRHVEIFNSLSTSQKSM